MLFSSADYIKMYSGLLLCYESRSDCNSCHVHRQLMLVFPMPKYIFCNGLTMSEGKISTSTSPLETKIIFKEKALHELFNCIVRGWHLNSAQHIYQRIRRIIALSNQIALILKCVDSVKSKRSFKSVKVLYSRFLNNIISYLSVLLCINIFLTTYITPLLNSYAVMLTQVNSVI